MNRTITVLLCLLFTVGSAVSVQAAKRSPAYEHLKALEWQIGDWETTYKAASDAGPIKKGDLVTVHFSLRWAPDRSFIKNTSHTEVSGKRIASSLEVISWNAKNSIIEHAYFGTWGVGRGIWTTGEDKAVLKWKIDGEHGAIAGTSHVAKVDENSWKWQIQEQTLNGGPQPNMPLSTFERELGVPAGESWGAYRKMATGKWQGKGKLSWDIPRYDVSKGDGFELDLVVREDMGGSAVLGEQEFRMKTKPLSLSARVVSGWDPSSQQVRLYAFWDDGFIEELFFSKRDGDTFIGTYTAKAPGGPVDRSPIALRFNGPDAYEYVFLAGPDKGKVLSSWQRVKE